MPAVSIGAKCNAARIYATNAPACGVVLFGLNEPSATDAPDLTEIELQLLQPVGERDHFPVVVVQRWP